ncbi:MAG: methyltransferase domain-containing protein [Ignavibacteria bacterium]|nr:methyltransferase domain-containing protein [Ignavibacteria bacterium]
MKYIQKNYDFNNPQFVSLLDEVPFWSAPFGISLLNEIRWRRNMTVLDIGFGTGFPLVEIAKRMGGRGQVYGIDPWVMASIRAKERVHHDGLENVIFLNGVAENMPLQDGCIDLIVSNNGINNVQDINKVMSEAARVARFGAQLIVTVNLEGTMAEFYTVFMQVLHDFGLNDHIVSVREHIRAKRRPVAELRNFIEQNKFTINSIKDESFRYTFPDATAMFRYPFLQYAFLPSWVSLVPAAQEDEIFNEVEKRMNLTSEEQGYCQLTIPYITITAERQELQ